ncbi:hypothetical protein [Gordonia humi]|uniref:Uncharacterized protein n=1 Tax=Gordonia humi TaxID=686429 RepID=A0A840ET47_9ACTN|nr:hypothetical protein [Gordonia humi]MBB4134731.1 hypothetical protein [Gordonia humi]
MSRPQEDHADLGLIEDDNTPDMRKTPVHPAKNVTEVSESNNHQEVN